MAPQHKEFFDHLVQTVADNPHLCAVMQYGSTVNGNDDEYSDIDLILVCYDQDALDHFHNEWQEWLSHFGQVRLAYIGMPGTPWSILEMPSGLLRVDLTLVTLDDACRHLQDDWRFGADHPNQCILHDDSPQQRLTSAFCTGHQAPPDLQESFDRIGGDFWYFCHRLWACLQRDEVWFARRNYQIVCDRLAGLLRIAYHQASAYRLGEPTRALEQDLPQTVLDALEQTTDIRNADTIRRSCLHLIELAIEYSERIASELDCSWPERLSYQLKNVFADGSSAPSSL